MPVIDHPSFRQPPDNEGALWRYIDLLKLVSLFNHSALYLTNLVRMGSLDPYEGILPAKNYLHRDWKLPADLPDELMEQIKSANPEDLKRAIANRFLLEKSNREKHAKIVSWFRRATFINCWHHSKFESAAMWQVYAQKSFGIAIRTSISGIKDALENEEREIYLGFVQYLDFDEDYLRFESALTSVLSKRIFFKHEQEIRLVHVPLEALYPDANQEPPAPGVYAHCNLQTLIEEIVVSPCEPDWVFDEVRSLVDRYQINVPVRHSELMKAPSV